MPRAICEDCGSLVEAELTHNGICAVGHYVHCGWGHELSPDDLISDDVAEIISKLEANLAKAVEALEAFAEFDALPTAVKRPDLFEIKVRKPILRTIAEIKGESHE